MLDEKIKSILLDNVPDPIYIHDFEGKCIYANKAAFESTGYSESDISDISIADLYKPEDAAAIIERTESLLWKGEDAFESFHVKKDGTLLPVDVHTNTIKVNGQDMIMSIVKESPGKSPRLTELSLQYMLDSTPYCIMLIDSNKMIRYVNHATLDIFGYRSREDLIGRICHDVICPAERNSCPVWDLGEKLDRSERKALNRDGEIVPILKSATKIKIHDEEMLLEAFLDISRRKEAEEFIKGILESVDEGFIVIDRNYKIISANTAFINQTKFGRDDILNNFCYKISHKSDRPCHEMGEDCAVRYTFDTGEPHTTLHTHYDHDGSPMYVETKSFPLKDTEGNITSAIEIINDITERRRLEDQLRQSQKMEAIGTLTGGIAHDFNNILTTIIGYGEFLQEELEGDNKLKAYIEMINSSATKAARLTQSLLAFSRKQVIHPEPVDINSLIENLGTMLSRLIGEDIEIITELSPETLAIMADGVQIEQAIVNLITNSRDAMPDGGKVLIITEPFEIDRRFIETHGFGNEGRYARITISDTGHGIDKKILPQIFEPFFTTKEIGKGTGLGLSVVYGIIKQHDGFINVYSEPNIGTTFKILLPLAGEGIEKIPVHEPCAGVEGSETILVAEDDEAVRNLIVNTLSNAGYCVIEAINGTDAIDKFRENRKCIQLLLLDMVMPKKSGADVCREARELSPDIKAIMLSGYPADLIDKKTQLVEDINLIMKPLSPTQLLKKIREVIEK